MQGRTIFIEPKNTEFMKDNLLKSTLGRLRIVGFLEGASFLFLLGIAMPLKYLAGRPEVVKVTGMVHGLLFLLYILYLIQVKLELRWSISKTLVAFLASLIPFGTFYADAKLFRQA
jgi:integral membrane protein